MKNIKKIANSEILTKYLECNKEIQFLNELRKSIIKTKEKSSK